MKWNWQQSDWPHFTWNADALEELERQYLLKAGILMGALRHFNKEEKNLFTVELMTGEAVKTSEIEGEYLNRDSVQSSILRNLGMDTDNRRAKPQERGIADMMTDLFVHAEKPLSQTTLFNWHKMITNGRLDLKDVGRYRTHQDPMQVVSGRLDKPHVHFEAPPSDKIDKEMEAFLQWWKNSSPDGASPLPPLTRSGIAHLYFECIHPFEDGNGRMGRALAEKSLAENLGQPTLIALSQLIERNRKDYYDALEKNNKSLEITDWLVYFAQTVLKAQDYSIKLVSFLIEKTKLYDRLRGKLNSRQEKVLARIFREGIEGFKDGLSAENYISITGTSRATATRDLQELVECKALTKTGVLKSTRYHLNINQLAKGD